jgi:hypothetical protein
VSVVDKLKSRADQINAQRLGQDARIAEAQQPRRPDWLPEDAPESLPEGQFMVGFGYPAGQADHPDSEANRTDTVTHRTVDPYAQQQPGLSDAQRAGVGVQGALAARHALRREARIVKGKLTNMKEKLS